MTFDTRKYAMHVFVKNDTKGCRIASVYFKKVITSGEYDKTGSNISSDSDYTTVDEEGTYYETGGKLNASELFKNVYTKEAGKNPNANNSKSSLGITKTVTGDYGDKDKAFDFYIKLYEPTGKVSLDDIIKAKKDYDNNINEGEDKLWSSLTLNSNKDGIESITAYVQEISDAGNAPSETPTETGNGSTYNYVSKVILEKKTDGTGSYWGVKEVIPAGTSSAEKTDTFKLKNGQYLTFVSLPAGFTYTVTEEYSNKYDYNTSAVLFENVNIINGNLVSADGDVNAIQARLALNSDWLNGSSSAWSNNGGGMHYDGTTKPQLLTSNSGVTTTGSDPRTVSFTNTTGSKQFLIGEHDNSFDVINNLADTKLPATGLIVKNLPFIVMIALGVLAFLGLTKKRRAND